MPKTENQRIRVFANADRQRLFDSWRDRVRQRKCYGSGLASRARLRTGIPPAQRSGLKVNYRHMKADRYSRNRRNCSLSLLTTWLLASAILLLQSFGFVHGVVHRSGPGAAVQLSARAGMLLAKSGVEAAASLPAPVQGKSRLALLFSSHTNDSDCRLSDQANHGGAAVHVAYMALPVVLPSFAVAAFQGEALARWAALFDARGPPLTC